jgi:hypothetical protein
MEARAPRLRNAHRAVAQTAFVATLHVREAAKHARQPKSSKVQTEPAVPLRSPKIPTANVSRGIAMVPAGASGTTARRAVLVRNVCLGTAPTVIAAAMHAPDLVWPVQQPNAAAESMANADPLRRIPIPTTNARTLNVMVPARVTKA